VGLLVGFYNSHFCALWGINPYSCWFASERSNMTLSLPRLVTSLYMRTDISQVCLHIQTVTLPFVALLTERGHVDKYRNGLILWGANDSPGIEAMVSHGAPFTLAIGHETWFVPPCSSTSRPRYQSLPSHLPLTSPPCSSRPSFLLLQMP
jgi:hypothetical protein